MSNQDPAPPQGAVSSEEGKRGALDAFLSLFTKVSPGEGVSATLLTLNVMLLLLAYYLLKVVREPLILAGGGAELKTYAAAGQSLLLVGVVKGYDLLSQRLPRQKLITAVTLFFVMNLVVFAGLGAWGAPLGVPYYLWVGIFNLTVIAQFWSFAADIYTPEQGKRLFAILGVGSSIGAVLGARIAKSLFKPLGPYGLMLLAAGILLVSLGVTRYVDHREARASAERRASEQRARKDEAEQPLGAEGPLQLLLADRYLLLIAALILLLNWVNTTGEYVLDRTLLEAAAAQGLQGAAQETFIGEFKGDFFGVVNLLGVLLQLFAVSRIIKYLGVRAALVIVPAVALLGYGTIAFTAAGLSVIRMAKIAENSLDYSLQSTTQQALWLVTSREAKYKVKALIDTFLVRIGDVLAAVAIWAGRQADLSTKQFATLNVLLLLGWLATAFQLGKVYATRAPDTAKPAPAPASL